MCALVLLDHMSVLELILILIMSGQCSSLMVLGFLSLGSLPVIEGMELLLFSNHNCYPIRETAKELGGRGGGILYQVPQMNAKGQQGTRILMQAGDESFQEKLVPV